MNNPILDDKFEEMPDLLLTTYRIESLRSQAIILEEATKDFAGSMTNFEIYRGTVYEVAFYCFEKSLIEVILMSCDYNQTKAAAILGINRGTFRKKMKGYGL